MMIHTKLKRLFRAVAEKNGTLTSGKALAEAMGVKQPAISQWFGYARDREPLNQPAERLGQLIRLFREAGIPIETRWLEVPLDEFEHLLQKSSGLNVTPALSWADALRRYARAYDGFRLLRPVPTGGGFRLRLEGDPGRRSLDQLDVDERVYLRLEIPEDFLDAGHEGFVTVVHEAWYETTCLFPLDGANDGMINGDALRLPSVPDQYYQVTRPVGPQRAHAILTCFRPAEPVHAGLEDLDLHLGLDRLASELTTHPAADWHLMSLTYEVTEAQASRVESAAKRTSSQ